MSSFSARDLAGDADGEARAGERVAADEASRQAELAAERADLVLEQLAQRLDQLHVHALGQAADIVVALDRDRRAAGEGDALDHVGIERALGEEFAPPIFLASALEHVDEQRPMILRFFSGSVTPASAPRKVAGIDVDERDVVVVAEQASRPLGSLARIRPCRRRRR
jgi:hypothetical protein